MGSDWLILHPCVAKASAFSFRCTSQWPGPIAADSRLLSSCSSFDTRPPLALLGWWVHMSRPVKSKKKLLQFGKVAWYCSYSVSLQFFLFIPSRTSEKILIS
ncbi:hypothetical protein CEXT_573941 [Caerostris extrusa]|uniref:Uncharacterized protein n=1 Tax=Caerostris extrusa TaxID=172846 RepID=A0AAV4MU24_CAEEX|nr:hypothetical protein CEXT_573941 [Caerostris extrusa]